MKRYLHVEMVLAVSCVLLETSLARLQVTTVAPIHGRHAESGPSDRCPSGAVNATRQGLAGRDDRVGVARGHGGRRSPWGSRSERDPPTLEMRRGVGFDIRVFRPA